MGNPSFSDTVSLEDQDQAVEETPGELQAARETDEANLEAEAEAE